MEHITVDFYEALEQFKNMFPHVSEERIETILRRHSGNAGLAVDELLSIPNEPSTSHSSTANPDFLYLDPPPSYDDVVKTKLQKNAGESSKQTSSTSNTPRTSVSNENEMVDDEKLALMLQNEEFLRYLRENAALMREVYGNDYSRYAHRPRRSFQMDHPGIRYSQDYNRDRIIRHSSMDTSHPSRPLMEATCSVPNGPLVDFNYNDSTGWSKRIKSKLPGNKPSDYSLANPCPSGPYVADALEPYCSSSDFQSRLKAMSKTSKIMLVELAKKFSMKKQLKVLPSVDGPSHH